MFFSPNVLPVWNPFLKWKQKKNRERKRTATKPSGQVLPPFAKARKFVCENPELLWTTADPRTHPQATSLAPIHGTSWSCPSSARPWRARALRESISGLSRAAAFFRKKLIRRRWSSSDVTRKFARTSIPGYAYVCKSTRNTRRPGQSTRDVRTKVSAPAADELLIFCQILWDRHRQGTTGKRR